MNVMQLSSRIIQDNHDVSDIIRGIIVQTDELQNQQALVFSQHATLSGKTMELTALTQNAMHEVNSSLVELTAALAREKESRSRYVWNSCAMWVLERLLHCELCFLVWCTAPTNSLCCSRYSFGGRASPSSCSQRVDYIHGNIAINLAHWGFNFYGLSSMAKIIQGEAEAD
jgi:hypothetical protein